VSLRIHMLKIDRIMQNVLQQRTRIFFVLMVSVWFAVAVTAQEPVVREQTAGHPVAFEHQIIHQDSSFRVIIPFRIRYDFFVFIRSGISSTSDFTASAEVSAELIDSTGTSVARNIEQIQLTAAGNTPAELRTQFHQGVISFSIPRGTYTIVFTIDDKESKRRFSDAKMTFSVPVQNGMVSGLIPSLKIADRTFQLFNLGGDVLFSQEYGFLFISKNNIPSARYTLKKRHQDEDENEIIVSDSVVSLTAFLRTSCTVSPNNTGIELSLHDSPELNTYYFPVDGTMLRQGRYELTLTFADSTKIMTNFGARWLDMPLSLNDLDLAIEPLQFITTKGDYSNLRKGSRDSRINKFEEFWKKKDPTPATAYNEVLHEFYRRVDYAVAAFRTLRDMNGAVTDRGKVYILNGAPTTTERLLAPDGAPKEIWKYNSLNKVFTFEDPSKQGNYKLTEH
jgi:GWxTD domain-containing protein